jgi:predicted ester cyclase
MEENYAIFAFFFILPPTGNKISYETLDIYRIGEDGKIIEHKAIHDDLHNYAYKFL